MSNLANSYPIFESNQVLTSSQLNELVTYLDEQSRLTRVKLIGMGVTCGLEPVFNAADPEHLNQPTLKITQGVGVTSEGYLIKMGDCTATKYRPYTLPFSVNYAPFGIPQDDELEMYELLTEDAAEDPANPSTAITQNFFATDNKIIVLFIEVYDNDLGSCLSKACDDLGKSRTFTIRKLAISQADIDNIIQPKLGNASEFLFPGKYDLPEVIMPRVLFSPDELHSKGYYEFSGNYVKEMQSKTFTDLFDTALPKSYEVFEPLLGPVYGNINPLTSLSVVTTLKEFMNGNTLVTTGPAYLGMQYAYDYMKDLILAYNEFRDAAFELMSQCCPDMSLFPRHLMLGEALGTATCKPSEYRHYFIEALVTRDQKFLRDKAITLHKKLVLMTQKFDLETINNPSTAIAPEPLGEPLLITPSDDKRVPLSERAIPYYFRNDEPDSTSNDLGTLEENWSFDHKRKCLASKNVTPLSYNNQDTDQSAIADQIRTPLYYDIDKYSFLRIEGHLRQNYVAVQEELARLKDQFDLPFNIVALRLQGESPDEIRSRCSFNDLRTQYLTVREELICTFKTIFERFAVVDTSGSVQVKELPSFITELIRDCDNGSQFTGSISDFNNAAQPYTQPVITQEATLQQGDTLAFKTSSSSSTVQLSKIKKMSNVRDLMQNALRELCLRLDRLMNTQATNPAITLLPFDVADFDYGAAEAVSNKSFIKTYVEAMQFAIDTKVWTNHLLDQMIRSAKSRNTSELYFVLSQYHAEVFGQLDKVISSCYHRKLELIYYTMEHRVQHLKDNDQTLFSNFIKKHPGLEHKGGVGPGGTFVIVYNGDHIGIDLPRRLKAVKQKRVIDGLQRSIAVLESKPVLTEPEKNELVKNRKLVKQFAVLTAAIANPTIPTVQIDIDKDAVIADFALPYLCCSSSECEDMPTPTTIEELNIPAIATPAYVEYKLGDYAFGKDLDVSTNGFAAEQEIFIDVIARLQYENNIDPDRIRLKLVAGVAPKHYYDLKLDDFRVDSYRSTSSMLTFNAPSEAQATARGYASIQVQSGTQQQYISYKPTKDLAQGVDSFYYMFEILNDEGQVIKRSTVGKITIHIYE